MMVKNTLLELLFTSTIRSIYSAETQLARMLPKIVRRTGYEDLREAFQNLAEITERHLARLELISRRHGVPLTERGADGMRGIIEEVVDLLAADDDISFSADLAMIALMQKAGHYLQSSYSSALPLADAIGWHHPVATIEAIVEEEMEIFTTLRELADRLVAIAAAGDRRGKPSSSMNAVRKDRAMALSRRA